MPDANDDWLGNVFDRAIADNLCMKPVCTTCLSDAFRHRLLEAAAARAGTAEVWSSATRAALLQGLRAMPAIPWRGLQGVRLALMMIEPRVPELDEQLAGSAVGDELARMRAHHRQREEARRLHAIRNDPVAAAQRREALRAERQVRHQERLAAKQQHEFPRNRPEGSDT